MKKAIINFLKFSVFLSFGLGILYLVFKGQNEAYIAQCAIDGIPSEACSLINKVIEDFKGLNYAWVFAMFGAFLFSNVLRALRWNMLLEPLGRKPRLVNTFLTTMLGYFANLGLPRLGEVLKPVTLAGYEKISIEKVLGTIVVDRIMDVICLLTVIGIAFALEFDKIWGYLEANMSKGEGDSLFANPYVIALGTVSIIGLGVLFMFRNKIMETKLYTKALGLLEGFWDGIISVKKLKNPPLFILYTVMIWVAYYVMYYMYLPAFEPTANLGFTAALLIFVFGAFGIVIPSPGGMGSYHALVIAALAIYGVVGSDAFSFANFSFFSTQLINIIFGLIAVIFLPMINKKYDPIPIE